MHLLHAEVAFDELGGQPIEQLRVGRHAAELAEIARRLLQALAEVPLPEPIDGHAGEQRIVGGGQPVGKSLDPALAEVDLRPARTANRARLRASFPAGSGRRWSECSSFPVPSCDRPPRSRRPARRQSAWPSASCLNSLTSIADTSRFSASGMMSHDLARRRCAGSESNRRRSFPPPAVRSFSGFRMTARTSAGSWATRSSNSFFL